MSTSKISESDLLFLIIDSPESGFGNITLGIEIGEKNSGKVYIDLLFKTHLAVKDLKAEKAVFYANSVDYEDLWENTVFCKELLLGRSRKEQLNYAFNYAFFSGYQKVVMPRPDILNLRQDQLLSAFMQLNKHDVVFGPSKQGGYYLVGMKKPHAFLFDLLSESDEIDLEFFLKSCTSRSLSVLVLEELPVLQSVDDFRYLSSEERTRYHQLVGINVSKELLRNQIASYVDDKRKTASSLMDRQGN